RVRLHGWFSPATGAHHTVLFLHGNGGNISHRLDSLRIFNQLGLNTLIIDYRGYGLSTGSPSEAGTYSDARAAWRYLLTGRGIKPEQIIIFGRSLGGAVAVWLAVNAPARALIVESGFTSIPELAAHHYPLLPTRWLSRYSYNSVERLMEIRIPKLVVHSRNDEIVPFGQGRRLFAAARDPKQFLEISGDHNLGFLQTGGHYIAGLQNFLQTVDSRATR
ncbi:MAG: alpha/beta hydrolase, partial [Gammaproteobacteria bacterium]|nr:alpha/beta hydrolase [Gammaproteobacteria bacterium]